MALLTPNATYTINGVKVNEKIIPDGTVWKNDEKAKKAGFTPKSLYKKQQKLTNNSGNPLYVTIHNTDDLNNVNDDGEQYTRATYNENMGSARIHFYVDDICAWQNLKAGTGMCANDPEHSAEVSWHSGDGSDIDGGNMTSLSIEIIMGSTAAQDVKAKDNGARVAAWLLYKHGLSIDRLVTHTYWVNKSAGKTFSDPDTQSTNRISGKKWCPTYIFNSSNSATAKKNWQAFKALVNGYLDELKNPKPIVKPDVQDDKETFVKGDLVKILDGATYYNGKNIPSWVIAKKWYVISASGDRVVVDKSQDGKSSIMSPINAKYLDIIEKASKPTPAKTCTGKINGYNITRVTDCLVVYNKGTTTKTNKWGTEASVNANGIVTSVVSGVGNMTIPSGGYVISGHGLASNWIGNTIKNGNKITITNDIIKVSTVNAPSKTLEQIAKEVISGKYGNGHSTRQAKLKAAGLLNYYSYEEIRTKVNELIK